MIDFNDKIYDIVQENPKILDFLIANGFDQLKNKVMFNTMSKKVTLSMALKMKKVNEDLFRERLESFLNNESYSIDLNLMNRKKVKADINVEGVLPCPIRIPLLEAFEEWIEENKDTLGYTLDYELKSANLGLDWVKEQVVTGDVTKVPDILMSAGFDLFFDKKLIGQYHEKGVFEAVTDKINSDFCNEYIDLRDPENKYLITGVVPAVFLVNKEELGNRKIPTTWDELLSEEFEDSVAVPMGDLDLFNAIVVSLYKEYGMEGIEKLGRNYKKSLHPAEMVKAKGKNKSENPAVSIIPYFFTKMINGNAQVAIWPEDGAILSPIFMLAKKDKKKELQPIIDFFLSKRIGEIFSASGKFPSTNAEVSNGLEEGQKFKWVGWEFIHSTDIGILLEELENKFNEEILRG